VHSQSLLYSTGWKRATKRPVSDLLAAAEPPKKKTSTRL